jgi:heme/copper-type cytochrome/quinol oxidase subunit 3
MTTDAQVLEEVEIKPVEDIHPEAAHSDEPEEFELPPSTIAPLITGIGVVLALLGLIQPVLGVVGVVIALIGGLRMARFPEIDLHSHWLLQLDNRKFGMWAFISSEVMFFTSLIGAFVAFKANHPDEFAEAQEVLSLPLATLGTSVLIISSFAVVMALEALQSNSRRVFYNWVGLTVLFGATFLSIQAFEWYELMHEGIKADDVFGTVFFVTTGFHGLHVLGGVGWLAILLVRSLRGYYSAENYLGIELFGLYWHFVDVVWIVLFTVIYLIH